MKKVLSKRNTPYLVAIIILLACSVIYLILVRQTQLSLVERATHDRQLQQQKAFGALSEVTGESLAALAKDYTYWDEMVDFVRTADLQWATENLETAQQTYNTQAVWVYSKSGNLVYSFVNKEGTLTKNQPLPVPIDQVTKLLDQQKFLHFYFQQNGETFEVRAASIHPTNDPDRTTPPFGYFFVGRRIDQPYLEKIANPIDAQAEVVSTQASKLSKSAGTTSVLYFDLPDWSGQTLSKLQLTTQFIAIAELSKIANSSFIAQVTIILLLIIAVIVSLYYFIKLRQIALLKAEKASRGLEESESRFRVITETSPAGIFLFSAKEVCLYINPACWKLVGTKTKLQDIKLEQFVNGSMQKSDFEHWLDSAAQTPNFSAEVQLAFKGKRWFNVTIAKIFERDRIDGYLGIIDDITLRKTRTQEMEKQNHDLEVMNKAMIDREVKMIELKKELERLQQK